MGETQPRPRGLSLNGEINAGHIMQAVVLIVMIGSGIWAAAALIGALSAKSDQTARELTQFQSSMRETVDRIQTQVVNGLEAIQRETRTLPDQRARLDQVERRLTEGDARDVAQDARIGIVERQAIETRERVENLRAASSVTLPGAPGVRTR